MERVIDAYRNFDIWYADDGDGARYFWFLEGTTGGYESDIYSCESEPDAKAAARELIDRYIPREE